MPIQQSYSMLALHPAMNICCKSFATATGNGKLCYSAGCKGLFGDVNVVPVECTRSLGWWWRAPFRCSRPQPTANPANQEATDEDDRSGAPTCMNLHNARYDCISVLPSCKEYYCLLLRSWSAIRTIGPYDHRCSCSRSSRSFRWGALLETDMLC